MRALWSDRPNCSHNVSQILKVTRIRRVSEKGLISDHFGSVSAPLRLCFGSVWLRFGSVWLRASGCWVGSGRGASALKTRSALIRKLTLSSLASEDFPSH